MPTPPKTRLQLYKRAKALCGKSVGEIANILQIPLPFNTCYAKGFAGQLAEIALGATAGAKPIQDFPELEVELKTIPLGNDALPTETTHICVLLDSNLRGQRFETSNVYNKLKCILWLPIEGNTSIPLPDRCFGEAFFWSMTDAEKQQIKEDWEEIMEALILQNEQIKLSELGHILQLRPCGTRAGQQVNGFYLRRSFTKKILSQFLKGDLDLKQLKIIQS